MLQKVRIGQNFRMSAPAYNAFVDAANAHAAGQRNTATDPRDAPYAGDLVWLRNDSGTDADPFDVLGVEGVPIPPADNLVAFSYAGSLGGFALIGKVPDTTKHIGQWAVLLEPIANGRTGPAVISGVATIELAVPSTVYPHRFVDIAHNSRRAVSQWYGAAEILYEQTTGGRRWAYVRLGNFESPTYPGKVTQAGGIAADASGSVQIYAGGTGRETITAHFDWMSGTNTAGQNKECLVRFFRDQQRWRIVELEC